MSIETCLGLESDGATMHRIRASFPAWVTADPRLAVAETFDELRAWNATAPIDEINPVMQALAELAAVDGGDDVDAQAALACLLLGGATKLAWDLTRQHNQRPDLAWQEADQVDQFVASHLFTTIREFPWRELTNVVGNVLARTKYAVMRELDWPELVSKRRRGETVPSAWLTSGRCGQSEFHRTTNRDQLIWRSDEGPAAAERTVRNVCRTAVETDLISREDAVLLLDALAFVGDAENTTGQFPRKAAGLGSRRVAGAIAPHHHLSAATVQRRLNRAIRTLAENRELIA